MGEESELDKLEQVFQTSLELFSSEENGAYPYEQYRLLFDYVQKYRPKKALELGTGYGLTALTIAIADHQCIVDSVDKNQSVLENAQANIVRFNVDDRVNLINDRFIEFLEGCNDEQYDLVMFDGFAPGLTVFLELERVLKVGGLMVCANLRLRGDKRKISARMADSKVYSDHLISDDTTFGVKILHDPNPRL